MRGNAIKVKQYHLIKFIVKRKLEGLVSELALSLSCSKGIISQNLPLIQTRMRNGTISLAAKVK